MKPLLLAVTFLLGLGIALHLAMNAAVGAGTANVRMGNALFWCVGAVTALIVGATGYQQGFWSRAVQVPPLLWLAGAMGACLVFGIAFLIPRLGAGSVNIALLAGQVVGSVLIANFGLLSSPVETLNPVRIIGVLVMFAGAGMAVLGRWPLK